MNPNLLMIDDEAAIRELYSLYFNTQGFSVSTASNAVEALERVSHHKYEVIILDLGLGDSNGMDLIDPIARLQPGVPILIYTGRMFTEELRAEALAKGAAGFLSKSHPLNYVIDQVRRAIAKPKA